MKRDTKLFFTLFFFAANEAFMEGSALVSAALFCERAQKSTIKWVKGEPD